MLRLTILRRRPRRKSSLHRENHWRVLGQLAMRSHDVVVEAGAAADEAEVARAQAGQFQRYRKGRFRHVRSRSMRLQVELNPISRRVQWLRRGLRRASLC